MSALRLVLPRSLKELRIHLCQTSGSSRGARKFIEQHYVELKQQHPKFPILVRECSGVEPQLYGRFEYGNERSVSLSNKSCSEVSDALQTLVKMDT